MSLRFARVTLLLAGVGLSLGALSHAAVPRDSPVEEVRWPPIEALEGVPRILHDPIRPPYEAIGAGPERAWCVADPDVDRSVKRVACPVLPGSLAGTVAGVETQARETRILRTIVDLDAEAVAALEKRGLNARETVLRWIGVAEEAMARDVGIRMIVTVYHEHAKGGPLTLTSVWDRSIPNEYLNDGNPRDRELLERAWAHWSAEGVERDLILVVTAQHDLNVGVATLASAGATGYPHVAFVKLVGLDGPRRCLSVLAPGNCHDGADAWMPWAIVHEVGHTLAAEHHHATCGREETGVGCTVMLGKLSPYDSRLLEYSEANEIVIRAHAEAYLAPESEYDALVTLPGVVA